MWNVGCLTVFLPVVTAVEAIVDEAQPMLGGWRTFSYR